MHTPIRSDTGLPVFRKLSENGFHRSSTRGHKAVRGQPFRTAPAERRTKMNYRAL